VKAKTVLSLRYMSDFRNQVNSLSPAEKAELLDTVWESLEADSVLLTGAQRSSTTASPGMSKTPRMSFPGSKSGRVFSRSREARTIA
jgi:hypothetical protein